MSSLEHLKNRLTSEFGVILNSPNMEKAMTPGFVDKRLYAIYLIETFHYTSHNAKNQALVATRLDEIDPRYAKWCLKHANEEYGHELMAYHDLKAAGLIKDNQVLSKPLPNTQAFIAYIYWVAQHGHPYARLGYSYWAERSYEFIQPMVTHIATSLGIKPNAMTFYNEHSEIDTDHAKQVDDVITRHVKTKEEWEAVEETMVMSLHLTQRMMDGVFEEFIKLKNGKQSRFEYLNL